MEGKKIIEDLLKECTKFTIPGHVNTIAYLSIAKAGLDVKVKNLKLSRELTEEETLKFLDIFLPEFSKEVGVKVTNAVVKKVIEPREVFKLHYSLGYLTLALFFVSLATFNFWIGLLPLFTFLLEFYFGKKLAALTPEEGKKILRSFCIPLSGAATIFWAITLFLIWKSSFLLAILSGGMAFLSLAYVQFVSGPKVRETQEKLRAIILSKL